MRPRKEHSPDVEQDRNFVVALSRGLEILRAFGREGEALGNRDFAQRTGISKSTISRLTYTLHKLGYLSHDPDTARYRLAPPVLSLGFACLAGLPLRQLARPLMQELADYTGMPVAMVGRDQMSMVYLERCKGTNALTLAIDVGAHIKMATTAAGRASVAAMATNGHPEIIEKLRDHEGENWRFVQPGIEAAIESYLKRGYCTSYGEWRNEVNAVAVPLVPRDGSSVVVFNCGGPSHSLTRDWIESDVAIRLVSLVQRVSEFAP
jgi:DNA-binding IclR family transcriptional regulator